MWRGVLVMGFAAGVSVFFGWGAASSHLVVTLANDGAIVLPGSRHRPKAAGRLVLPLQPALGGKLCGRLALEDPFLKSKSATIWSSFCHHPDTGWFAVQVLGVFHVRRVSIDVVGSTVVLVHEPQTCSNMALEFDLRTGSRRGGGSCQTKRVGPKEASLSGPDHHTPLTNITMTELLPLTTRLCV